MEAAHIFEPKISLDKPVEDYKTLVKDVLQTSELIADDVHQANYTKIFKETQKVVWQLLFARQPANNESVTKAAELLKEYKRDACFYAPWDYNLWIVEVRDELLKRNMISFWRDEIVKHELGPCWARDSDLFDDLEDREPEEFYRHAGCVAPFSKEAKQTNSAEQQPSARRGATVLTEVKISMENPVEDYETLIKDVLQCDYIVSDEIHQENRKRIFAEVHKVLWKLLFDPQEQNIDTAAKLLRVYKQDASFYFPWSYNEWIVKVRDELLKREMIDFWRDVVVKNELGPCWARDSDLFENSDDPEPEAFYNFAGCVAPFSKSAPAHDAPKLDEAHISLETPIEDYEKLVKDVLQCDYIVSDEVHQANQEKIFTETRKVIWALLFEKEPAAKENLAKAADLLKIHKPDAGFYSPWDYNEWIVKVRDELLKRNMIDFWRNVIVKHELGPCWARDSDLFDEMDDPEPEAFYKYAGCVAPFSKEAHSADTAAN